jgi:hypothetical protein
MSDDSLMETLTGRRRKEPPPREAKEEPPNDLLLPEPGRPYEAFRAASRPVFTLHCLLGKDGIRSFQFPHLASNTSFEANTEGQIIRLRFCCEKVTAVTIRGRNLSKLHDYLHQHRVAWVWRIDGGRDFGGDKEAVITAIDIEEVKEVETGS